MILQSLTEKKRATAFAVFAIVLSILMLAAAPALAQLTEEDIERLREQGKREGWTFDVGLCETTSKYSQEQLCGMKKPEIIRVPSVRMELPAVAELPERWDWRDYDGVSSVKNQGGCGSCWAFATAATFEAAIKIRLGIEVDLSEQWLVSCNQDDWSCGGGWYAHS